MTLDLRVARGRGGDRHPRPDRPPVGLAPDGRSSTGSSSRRRCPGETRPACSAVAMMAAAAACGGGVRSRDRTRAGAPTLLEVQAQVFTPRCALSGCHVGGRRAVRTGPEQRVQLVGEPDRRAQRGDARACMRVDPGRFRQLVPVLEGHRQPEHRRRSDAPSGGPLSAADLEPRSRRGSTAARTRAARWRSSSKGDRARRRRRLVRVARRPAPSSAAGAVLAVVRFSPMFAEHAARRAGAAAGSSCGVSVAAHVVLFVVDPLMPQRAQTPRRAVASDRDRASRRRCRRSRRRRARRRIPKPRRRSRSPSRSRSRAAGLRWSRAPKPVRSRVDPGDRRRPVAKAEPPRPRPDVRTGLLDAAPSGARDRRVHDLAVGDRRQRVRSGGGGRRPRAPARAA